MEPPQAQSHLSPGKILCGAGSLRDLPTELNANEKHIVITDGGISAAGIAGRLMDVLRESGIQARLFDEIQADPSIESVHAALEVAREEESTAVIGLGGGSSIDAAKALAALLSHQETLREFGDGAPILGAIAPLYAIPTNAGTGSEVTRVAVITDDERHEKMAIRGAELAPRCAVLDPELLVSLPARIAAESSADALSHAVEAFVSTGATPLTDALALAAIRDIGLHARAHVADRGDLEAGARMLTASCLAGQAFTNAGLGLVHSLGEPLGARYHLSHGLSCALFLPVIMEFNLPVVRHRMAEVHAALTGTELAACLEGDGSGAATAVRELFANLGLPATYAQTGIEFTLEEGLIDAVWPQSCTRSNPRTPTEEDVRALYLALDERQDVG